MNERKNRYQYGHGMINIGYGTTLSRNFRRNGASVRGVGTRHGELLLTFKVRRTAMRQWMTSILSNPTVVTAGSNVCFSRAFAVNEDGAVCEERGREEGGRIGRGRKVGGERKEIAMESDKDKGSQKKKRQEIREKQSPTNENSK